MRRLFHLPALLIIASFCFYPLSLSASAWTLAPGESQLVNDLYYYETDRYIDRSGRRLKTETYRKYALQQFIAYGVTEHLTLLGSFSQQYVSQKQAGLLPSQNVGWGDAGVGLRWQLHREGSLASSLQGWFFPGWRDQHYAQPEIGTPFPEAEIAFFQGYGSRWREHHWFLQGGTAYRWRGDGRAEQYRLELQAGFDITQDWSLSARLEHMRSLSPSPALPFITSAQDYDQSGGSMKLHYRYAEDVTLHLGAFQQWRARQTGRGEGIVLGADWRF